MSDFAEPDRTSAPKNHDGASFEGKRPAAPKPRRGPDEIPDLEDVLAPDERHDLSASSSRTVTYGLEKYTEALFVSLDSTLSDVCTRLAEPPAPRDPSFAAKVLGTLAGTLMEVVLGRISGLVTDALKENGSRPAELGAATAKPRSDNRGSAMPKLTEGGAAVVSDQLSSLSGFVVKKATEAASGPPPGGGFAFRPHKSPAMSLASKNLIEAFTQHTKRELTATAARALVELYDAADRAGPAARARLASLAEAINAASTDSTIFLAFEETLVTGWLNFCSSATLGPREGDETMMPGANVIGGTTSTEWRRDIDGAIDIHVQVPPHVRGMQGFQIGAISLASSSPAAAEMFQKMSPPRSLMSVPVVRRVWLGSHRLDASPDLFITPEHALEVNASSSLLAALSTWRDGEIQAVQFEGRSEEQERARLLKKLDHGGESMPRDRPHATGRLGALLNDQGGGAGLSAQEAMRLGVLGIRRVTRASEAMAGAATLVAWLRQFTTERLAGGQK